MTTSQTTAPADIVRRYNPAIGRHHLVSPEEWKRIGGLVRQMATPFTRLGGQQVRDYLRAATKLCAFALRHDGVLTVKSVLAPRVIEGYLRQVPRGARDEEPYLWRMALQHKTVAPGAPVRHQVGRRELQPPYSDQEVATLLEEARAQPTTLRRTTLLAIFVLGAGSGLVRESARDVCASDVHRHEDGVFVRVPGRCAKVLDGFEADLEELIALRPTGRLLGDAQARFATVKAHQWLDGRSGIPQLSVDRLRASYIHSLMRSHATLLEVLDWTGLRSTHSLWRYVEQTVRPSSCPLEDRA